MEKAKGSSEAVKLAGKHIIPILLQRGYIKGFEAPKPMGKAAKKIPPNTGHQKRFTTIKEAKKRNWIVN